MNRRTMLAATGGMAIPGLLLATGGQGRAQNAIATLDVAQHKMQTLRVGSLSLQLSQIALQQASHPKVKEFAGFERDEQMTIAQVLTDMQAPPPAPLDPAGTNMLQTLAATGPAQFDALYVADEIQGHMQLLEIQQVFLQGQSSMASDDVHVSLLARTVIQMHLAMLSDLQATLHG